jgi:hypothetical protein
MCKNFEKGEKMKNKLIKFTTSVLLVGLMVSATIEPAMAAESAVKFIVNDNSVKILKM